MLQNDVHKMLRTCHKTLLLILEYTFDLAVIKTSPFTLVPVVTANANSYLGVFEYKTKSNISASSNKIKKGCLFSLHKDPEKTE